MSALSPELGEFLDSQPVGVLATLAGRVILALTVETVTAASYIPRGVPA